MSHLNEYIISKLKNLTNRYYHSSESLYHKYGFLFQKTPKQLREYLDNNATGPIIDHIIPFCFFNYNYDLSERKVQVALMSYKNLRLVSREENAAKSWKFFDRNYAEKYLKQFKIQPKNIFYSRYGITF